MILQILLLCIGFVLLVKGADFFVDGAAGIAEKMGIPQLVVGLTIVAMGTSLPEAAVSITSALKGSAGITIGNVIGSNIMNVLVILGITAVITNVAIQKSTLYCEIPFMIGSTILMIFFGMTRHAVTFVEGVIFWIIFIIFLAYLFMMSKKNKESEEKSECEMSYLKCIIFIIAGGIMVVWGSDLVVDAASEIARSFGMSERFIGLTIVAFGTSLPELVTSVTAAKSGNVGIAIGNIVGSNIFNLLFVIGTTALICSVPFESKFLIDAAVAVGAGVILWLGTIRTRELRRPCGVVMLFAYAGYFAYLCMN